MAIASILFIALVGKYAVPTPRQAQGLQSLGLLATLVRCPQLSLVSSSLSFADLN